LTTHNPFLIGSHEPVRERSVLARPSSKPKSTIPAQHPLRPGNDVHRCSPTTTERPDELRINCQSHAITPVSIQGTLVSHWLSGRFFRKHGLGWPAKCRPNPPGSQPRKGSTTRRAASDGKHLPASCRFAPSRTKCHRMLGPLADASGASNPALLRILAISVPSPTRLGH
jgi:hypothetical protein